MIKVKVSIEFEKEGISRGDFNKSFIMIVHDDYDLYMKNATYFIKRTVNALNEGLTLEQYNEKLKKEFDD